MYQEFTKTKNLLTVAMLLVFCAFTNKAMAWEGNGTASNPWKIGDTQTNTATAVTAVLSGNTLTISGSGNMADFWNSTEGEAPWWINAADRNAIQTVVFQNGSNVKNIGNKAFKDCSNLRTITIPNSVLFINEQAFLNCTSLQNITIPNTVQKIRGEAFKNCSALETLIIQNGLNELFFYGYCYWSSNNSITREDEVWCSSWTRNYFTGCSSLQELHLGRNISASYYDRANGFFYGNSSIEILTIGSTVSLLSTNAFYFANCGSLKYVTLEDGTLPLSFNNLSDQFQNCPIQTFHWGRNLTNTNYWQPSPIQEKATLTMVTIGNYVSSIMSNAFYGCISLTTITSQRAVPPTANNNCFFNVNKTTCTVNVPQGTKCAYKSASGWQDFENIIDGTTTLCGGEPFTLTFNAQDGIVTPTNKTVYYDQAIGTLPMPTRDCYDFGGWFSEINGAGTEFLSSTIYNYTTDKTIYAKWAIKTYSVNFAGTDINIPSQTINCGNPATRPTNPERDDYNFVGWFVDNGTFANEWNFSNTVTQNITLYAKWEEKPSGIDDILTNSTSIFPNPVKEDLYIVSENKIEKVEIYTLAGSLIFSENNFNGKISVSTLPQGVYLLNFYTDKGVTVSKIVKE